MKFNGFKVVNGDNSVVFDFNCHYDCLSDMLESIDVCCACASEDEGDISNCIMVDLAHFSFDDDYNFVSVTSFFKDKDNLSYCKLILDGEEITLDADSFKKIGTVIGPEELGTAPGKEFLIYKVLDSDFGKIVMWYYGDLKLHEYNIDNAFVVSTLDEFKNSIAKVMSCNGLIDLKDFIELGE